MSKNQAEYQVLVNNLPATVAWQDVKELFSGTGHILRVEVMHDQTGKSHGHGVVFYASEQEARKAVEQFDNYTWKEQPLQVSQIEAPGAHETIEESLTIGDTTIKIKRQFYVDNLPNWVRWQDLKDLFFQAGTVLRTDIAAKTKQHPNHSGVVLFASRHDAKKAIELFHNYEWDGQHIRIREDNNFIDYAPPDGVPVISQPCRRQRRSGGRPTKKSNDVQNVSHEVQIYVNNLPSTYRWQELKQLFSKAGQVIRATVVSLPSGQSRRFGTVLFATADEARTAIELFNGYSLDDVQLHVKYDRYASSKQSSSMSMPVFAVNATSSSPSIIPSSSAYTLDHTTDVDAMNHRATIHDPSLAHSTSPLIQHYNNGATVQSIDSSSDPFSKGADWYMANSIPTPGMADSNHPASHWIPSSSSMPESNPVSNVNHSVFYANYHNPVHQPGSITHLPVNMMPHYHPVIPPIQSPHYLPMPGHPLTIPPYYVPMPVDANHHYHGPQTYYSPVYAMASTPPTSIYPSISSPPINSSQSNEQVQALATDMLDSPTLYDNRSSVSMTSETLAP